MTTTPAPTDHDTLKALQDRARNLVPWQARIDLLQRHDALLDELAKTRRERDERQRALIQTAGWQAEAERNRDHWKEQYDEQLAATRQLDDMRMREIGEVRRERDAAREELAKTRDAHDETIHAARGFSQMAIAEADRLRAEVTTWKRKAAKLRAELGSAKARISAAATVQVWTNEDGERFVFADDLMEALDPNPETNPATTAEPADEPKATCHLPVQNGEPCGLLTCRKHGCRVAPQAEPAAG